MFDFYHIEEELEYNDEEQIKQKKIANSSKTGAKQNSDNNNEIKKLTEQFVRLTLQKPISDVSYPTKKRIKKKKKKNKRRVLKIKIQYDKSFDWTLVNLLFILLQL